MFNRFLLCLCVGLAVSTAPAQAAFNEFIRPDYQNPSGVGTISGRDPNPGLIPMQGLIFPSNSPAAPSSGTELLTEASFGQPFAPFAFTSGQISYANTVAAQVRAALYPDTSGANGSRANVLASRAAFRYKWLLFSPEPGETDVTTHFQKMSDWFGDAERAVVNQQIGILRDALAVSPFDSGLRHLLLDCYYDLAVAEMQFGKQQLASLAAKHLGLTITSPFVIDDEIRIYESLITLETNVLAKYSELFNTTVEGIDPADFDERVTSNTPMGLYIFLREQPFRNAIASQYAGANGTEYIPTIDSSTNAVPRGPENLVLFSGYKDYATLFSILGNYIQHEAELARLRGMRQGPNDLVKARNAITKIQTEIATDFLLLRRVFTNEFLPGDASGVNAAQNGVETALADINNVRTFLNGTANLLGLDPNFLLLVQGANLPGGYNNESFDVLYSMLKGPNQPLGDALAKLTEATTKYQTFRASVDQVVKELAAVGSTYEDRFFKITGYEVDENPGFKGIAKPNSGSELDLVEQSIKSLESRSKTLKTLQTEIRANLVGAQAGLTLAQGLDGAIDAAFTTYTNNATSAYKEMAVLNGLGAAAQGAFDTLATVSSLDLATQATGAGAFVAIAGTANAAFQGVVAGKTTTLQRDIDFAAVAFDSATQKADNALTVNQARQEVGAIHREQHANTLEITDNKLALAQAHAQRTALLAELQNIAASQKNDTAAVRKSYFADPIHHVRSENALILADAAFRNAQRWVFYTQRALEYKWQQKFARTENSAQGIRTFDSGSIFKMRNAAELDDLLTQLKGWNDDRFIQDTGNDRTTFISMINDVLSPNPNVINATPARRADPGVRVDLATSDIVSQLEHFHRQLTRGMDENGNLNIDFDTTRLDSLQADFFVGPNYTATSVAPGEWRDKIIYLKVNIIGTDGTPIPQNRPAAITYGGQTFFRTRIPPCPDRSVVLPPGTPDGITPTDLPGEFFTAPFRFYASPNYNNAFVAQDSQTVNVTAAYTGATARSATGEEILGSTYQVNAFNQRSVATTRWRLTLYAPPTGWDVSKLKDIELIVRHHSSGRLAPICN